MARQRKGSSAQVVRNPGSALKTSTVGFRKRRDYGELLSSVATQHLGMLSILVISHIVIPIFLG